MAIVNPPPIPKIPQTFLKNKETKFFFQQIQKILLQIHFKIGGGSDSDLTNTDDFLTSGDLSYLRSQLSTTGEVETDTTQLAMIHSELKQLRREIEDLKTDTHPVLPLSDLFSRIDDIEAQL